MAQADAGRPALTRFFCRAALAAGLAAGAAAGPAHAAWPADQPINLIIAYAPGGGTDIVARNLIPFLEKHLGDGAKINVINRPGAGGAIGFAAIAQAPPDGYTIGFINTPPIITTPIERQVAWTLGSYDYLGNIVDDPGTFCVHRDSAYKTLADIQAFARANPKKVTVGTTGVGSDDHLAMLMFEKSAGVQMTHVPFKGSADTRTAIIGRHIEVAAINVGEALQYIKGGSPIRCLGQMTAARMSMAPDWPTFKEQGYNFEMASLRGMAAPKGLPPAVRERLVRAIGNATSDPAFRAAAEAAFAPVRYLAPAAYEAELRAGDTMFRQLWKELPWTDK
ncbi:MAG: tripartite tricarboxylate transporter substrate binding protein [Burkholderiales bacterium]|nr:tripartite tricarboxylate transporter substrate binding protein [Burkholderiales bacterium]